MPTIICDIEFNIGGVNRFGRLFREPIDDLNELERKLNKIAHRRVGRRVEGLGAVTRQDKQAALEMLEILKKIKTEKSLIAGQTGKQISKVGIKSGIDELGNFKINKATATTRKASKTASQYDFGQQLHNMLARTQKSISERLNIGARAGGRSADRFSRGISTSIDRILKHARMRITKALDKGKLTTATGKEIMSDMNLALKGVSGFKTAVDGGRASMLRNLESMVMRREAGLKIAKMHGGKSVQGDFDKMLLNLKTMFRTFSTEISSFTPTTKAQFNNFKSEFNRKMAQAFTGMDVDKAAVQKKGRGNLASKGMIRAGLGTAGLGVHQMGSWLEQGINNTHTRQRLASGITEVFMSAFYISGYTIMQEVVNIGAQIVDIFVETLMEIPRMIGAVIAGLIKALGTLLVKGFLDAGALMMGGLAGILTGGMGWAIAIIASGGMAIMTVFNEISSFAKNILTSLMSAIGSIFKLGFMLVVSIAKGFGILIKGIFKSIWEGIKGSFKGFMSFMKQGFKSFAEIAKSSMEEFVSSQDYAIRSYKETIGLANNSTQKFLKMQNLVRSSFGLKREDVGEATFDIVSSGYYKMADATKIMNSAITLSMAANSDLKTSVNALITAYQNFAPEGESLDHIMKVMSASARLGRMTMQELGNSMKSIMGIASATGMKFEDLMATLAMSTRVFGRGSIEEGTKYMSRFIEAIAMPSSRASKEIESLGVKMQRVGKGGKSTYFSSILNMAKQLKNLDFKDVNKIFTTIQSRRQWLALTKDLGQFEQLLKDMKPSMATIGEQFDAIYGGAKVSFGRIVESVKVVQVALGQTMWDIIQKAVYSVANTFNFLARVLSDKRLFTFAKAFADYLAPIGSAILGPLNTMFKEFVLWLNRGSGAGNDFAKVFKTAFAMDIQKGVINIANNIWKIVNFVYDFITSSEGIAKYWQSFKDIVAEIFGYFSTTGAEDWISAMINGVNIIKALLESVFTGTLGDMAWFQDIVNALGRTIMQLILSIANVVKAVFKPLIDRFMQLIGNGLKNTILGVASKVIIAIAESIDTKIGGIFGNMVGGLKEMLMSSGMALSPNVMKKESTGTDWTRLLKIIYEQLKIAGVSGMGLFTIGKKIFDGVKGMGDAVLNSDNLLESVTKMLTTALDGAIPDSVKMMPQIISAITDAIVAARGGVKWTDTGAKNPLYNDMGGDMKPLADVMPIINEELRKLGLSFKELGNITKTRLLDKIKEITKSDNYNKTKSSPESVRKKMSQVLRNRNATPDMSSEWQNKERTLNQLDADNVEANRQEQIAKRNWQNNTKPNGNSDNNDLLLEERMKKVDNIFKTAKKRQDYLKSIKSNPEEIRKKAEAERKANYETSIKKMPQEELESAFKAAKAKRIGMERTVGGINERDRIAKQEEEFKHRAEWENDKDSGLKADVPLDFESWRMHKYKIKEPKNKAKEEEQKRRRFEWENDKKSGKNADVPLDFETWQFNKYKVTKPDVKDNGHKGHEGGRAQRDAQGQADRENMKKFDKAIEREMDLANEIKFRKGKPPEKPLTPAEIEEKALNAEIADTGSAIKENEKEQNVIKTRMKRRTGNENAEYNKKDKEDLKKLQEEEAQLKEKENNLKGEKRAKDEMKLSVEKEKQAQQATIDTAFYSKLIFDLTLAQLKVSAEIRDRVNVMNPNVNVAGTSVSPTSPNVSAVV